MPERILIIDDDLDTLKLVGLMLQRKGYEILAASDGTKGLREAIDKQPDLILLDVMMPGMDGYQVAKLLRQNAETADIPILMFTAKSQLDDKVTGFEVGADDYLTKPTHPTELLAHVKALLARSPRRRNESAAALQAYVIGVMGVRGGWGATTIAASLAQVIAMGTKKRVALAEMQPGRGALAASLGSKPSQTLETLLAEPAVKITSERLTEALVEQSGVHFLFASLQPEKTALLWQAEEALARVVNRLASTMDYVVLDLGSFFVPSILQAYMAAQGRVLIVEPMPLSVLYARAATQSLAAAGLEPTQVQYVVNSRERSELKISWMEVEKRLGQKVAANIMPVPELVHQGRQRRMLAAAVQPQSLFNKQIQKLATALVAAEAKPA